MASVLAKAYWWADLVSYARRTSALSLYNASPTARAQRSSQSYKDPGLLATRKNMYTNDGSAAGATQAKSDESSSYHMWSHACEAPSTGCVAEVNQVELPSDAGWANLVEPPDNSKSEDAPRKQTTKRASSPGHKSKRPNFFFALQVSQSAAVIAAIKSVHDSLVQHANYLQAALVEPETAHLTIMVTALDSEEEVQHAEAAMESFTDQLAAKEAWTKPLALTLEGLSHFCHQVLYLDIKKDSEHERLLELAKAFRDHMQASGVESSDSREFTGHVTIAKLSKIRTKKRNSGVKLKKIAEEGYAQQLSVRAGEVLVTELQMCQMQGREAGAYYNIQRSFAFCRRGER